MICYYEDTYPSSEDLKNDPDYYNLRPVYIEGTSAEWEELARFLLGDPGQRSFEPFLDSDPLIWVSPGLKLIHTDAERLAIEIDEDGYLYVAGTPTDCAKISGLVLSFTFARPGESFRLDCLDSDYISETSASITMTML